MARRAATATAPLPNCCTLVGIAPACELEDEAAVPLEAVEAAVAVPVEPELAAVVVVDKLVAFLVPQLSLMLVVQFAWPVALPTLVEIQLSKVCWHSY